MGEVSRRGGEGALRTPAQSRNSVCAVIEGDIVNRKSSATCSWCVVLGVQPPPAATVQSGSSAADVNGWVK